MKAGHKISVLAEAIPGSPMREIINGIEEIRTRAMFTMFRAPIMPNYYRCLSHINPDVIHAHGAMPGVSDAAIFYASRNSKPSVFDYQFDGHAESAVGSLLANIYNYSINTIAASKASRITATSKSYAETSPVLKRHLNKVEIIPNGVDLQLFNPEVDAGDIKSKYDLPQEHIILYAGRFVKYKGIDYLVRAMKYVEQGTLVVAGSGPLERHLNDLVKEQNLSNVKFIGLIAHEDLPRLYKVSDIYVLPAISRGENFGISALEAMACGTPVVASKLPGVMELVTDECGIKVQPKDILELAGGINRLIANPNLKDSMGRAAIKNAEKYNWKHIAGRVLQIYEELLN